MPDEGTQGIGPRFKRAESRPSSRISRHLLIHASGDADGGLIVRVDRRHTVHVPHFAGLVVGVRVPFPDVVAGVYRNLPLAGNQVSEADERAIGPII